MMAQPLSAGSQFNSTLCIVTSVNQNQNWEERCDEEFFLEFEQTRFKALMLVSMDDRSKCQSKIIFYVISPILL